MPEGCILQDTKKGIFTFMIDKLNALQKKVHSLSNLNSYTHKVNKM